MVAEKANKTIGGKSKMNSKSTFLNYEVMKEEISPDNVFAMAEIIAFAETRYLIGYMGTQMQKTYVDLYKDILNKNDVTRVLSDGYDLVQECALWLCEHYGKHLSDIIGYTKKGKKITVQMACIRKMNKLINRKTRDRYRNVSLEALTRKSEPIVEIKEEVQQDYEQCDKIVDSLNLTENMKIALECRMAGLSYPEIGRILERAQATVYEYFIKMRARYTAIYG